MSSMTKNVILWVVIALVMMAVVQNFGPRREDDGKIDYSDFIQAVKQGMVRKVVIDGNHVDGVNLNGESFKTYAPQDDHMIDDLLQNGVKVEAKPPESPSLLMHVFINWFPMLLLIGVWIFFMRQMQGGGKGGAFSFG